jgi:hypothetical protein
MVLVRHGPRSKFTGSCLFRVCVPDRLSWAIIRHARRKNHRYGHLDAAARTPTFHAGGCCRDLCGHHAGIDPLHGVVPVWLERLRAGRREIEAMTRAGTFEFYERCATCAGRSTASRRRSSSSAASSFSGIEDVDHKPHLVIPASASLPRGSTTSSRRKSVVTGSAPPGSPPTSRRYRRFATCCSTCW